MNKYIVCGGRGYSNRKHLLARREKSDFPGAFLYVMECGEKIVSAEAPKTHEDWEFCKKCAGTKRGKCWLQRNRKDQ